MELGPEGTADLARRAVEPQVGPNREHRDVDVVGGMKATVLEVRVTIPAPVVDVHCAVSSNEGQELAAALVPAGGLLLFLCHLFSTLGA